MKKLISVITAAAAVAAISAAGEQAYVIGECVNGAEKGVELV